MPGPPSQAGRAFLFESIRIRHHITSTFMKSFIVQDGGSRLCESSKIKARLLELQRTIRERHAAELAQAGFLRRLFIHRKIAAEFRRERTGIVPSPQSLFCR